MSAWFHLALLGGFRIRQTTGPPVVVASKKARALLAYLAKLRKSTWDPALSSSGRGYYRHTPRHMGRGITESSEPQRSHLR